MVLSITTALLLDSAIGNCGPNSKRVSPFSTTSTCFKVPLFPMTPFFRMGPLLYKKFENMVIFRPGNLYSLCSPGNQENYSFLIFFIKKGRNLQCKIWIFIGISLLELLMNRDIIIIFDYRTLIADFDLF